MNKTKIILNLILLLYSYLLFSQNINYDSYSSLQNKCNNIFKNIDGCLGIVELKSNKIITTVNKKLLIENRFKPGSIVKIITAIAAINSGKVDILEEFNCTGNANFDNESYKCWLPKGHSKVNLIKAISLSCNLYFLNIASKLTIDEILSTFAEFHFDEKTIFNISGEATGLFRKNKIDIEKYYLSIGCSENLLVTPLQILQMITFIANKKLPNTKNIDLNNPKFDPIYKGLRNSVLFGTSKESNYLKLQPAGKTGTISEKYNIKNSAWFIGYAPYYNPEIAIVIFIKNGRGATNAAPIAKKVFKCYYELFHR